MKIKLTNEQLSKLELHVIDKSETRKNNRIKNKFLNGKSENNFIISHLSDDEYLYLLDKIEENMCDDISDIYHKLIMQDNKDLIKPFEIANSII
jgi:hypothetical protein